MSRSAISASPALPRPGGGWSRAAQGRLAIGGVPGAGGYRRERRGRNLIQATMAMATSSQGENRRWTVKLRTARATMAMQDQRR